MVESENTEQVDPMKKNTNYSLDIDSKIIHLKGNEQNNENQTFHNIVKNKCEMESILNKNGMDDKNNYKQMENDMSLKDQDCLSAGYPVKNDEDQNEKEDSVLLTSITLDEKPIIERASLTKTPVNSHSDLKSHEHISFSKTDLKTMLTGLKDQNQSISNSIVNNIPCGISTSYMEDDDSTLSEVDSDAPTELASPPRVKRRRLVRGDQIFSTEFSRRHSLSDSELSDLDDLKSGVISSSILHEGSSPIKTRIKLDSSPRKSLPTQKKKTCKLNHVAVSKINKNRKGIYRDLGGRTRLQIACDKGKFELVKRLIEEENYDVNDQDNAGNSSLHEAALNGHYDIVKLLLNHGAHVNIQSYEMFGDTPLIDASANRHLDVVRLLLDNGADPTIVNSKGLTAIESIEESSDLDDDELKVVNEIKDLLRCKTKRHKEENNVYTCSHHSAHNKPIQDEPTRSLSVINKVDLNFVWTDINSKKGNEKLLIASREGALNYVGAFLENGGRVDFKSFIECVKFGHEDVASLFLAFGADANASSKDGLTLLMAAAGRGYIGIIKLLLNAGADPTKCDKNGNSILYYAEYNSSGLVSQEETELIKKAIEKHSELNIKDHTSKKLEEKSFEYNHLEEITIHSDSDKIPKKKKIVGFYESKSLNVNENDNKKETTEIYNNSKITSPSNIPEVINQVKDKIDNSPTSSNIHIPKYETQEEKQSRIKKEEEYRFKRLQIKKKKEEELLKRWEEDERKRIEEKEKAELEHNKQLEQEAILKRQEQETLKLNTEIENRIKIRSMYPIGLILIDFEDLTISLDNYLPLYYTNYQDEIYVLDLQISIILRDVNFTKKHHKKHSVTDQSRFQLWNIYKFLFLFGGNGLGHKILDLSDLSLDGFCEFEEQEFLKFIQLPLNWIAFNEIEWKDKSILQTLKKYMVEIAILDNFVESGSLKKSLRDSISNDYDLQSAFMPPKFQNRTDIQKWVIKSENLW